MAHCRKCLRGLSKMGTTTPSPHTPPTLTTSSGRGVESPTDTTASNHSDLATAVVIVAAVGSLILFMMVVAIVLRRRRIQAQRMSENITPQAAGDGASKREDGDVAMSEDGKWSADAVELVVMAGETSPSFVAHPVPAFSDSSLPREPQTVPLPEHPQEGHSTSSVC